VSCVHLCAIGDLASGSDLESTVSCPHPAAAAVVAAAAAAAACPPCVPCQCDNPYDTRFRPERLLLYDKHPGGIGLVAQVCGVCGGVGPCESSV
jgi:hypothetical protein